MALQTFTWPVQTRPTGSINFRVRKTTFGEGYVQRVGDGLHTKSQSWSVVVDGTYDETQPVLDFLDYHAGHISFQWAPPGKPIGRFVCESYQEIPHVGTQRKIQAIFDEVFQP